MCGIVGIVGPQEANWIKWMNLVQVHRGPDDEGVFRDEKANVTLAMRRLAILDLQGGHQPMTTDDGRYAIVFNGEIYNAPDLRKYLEAKGCDFRTDHSDTEVLLRLYAFEGETMLSRLNGMFAFAIYDREASTLFCARDRFGIKPFYYLSSKQRFAFASELKSVLQLPFVAPVLDSESLFHYLSLMYVPGANTIIEGVKRLPAGHKLTYRIREQTITVERWWSPEFRSDIPSANSAVQEELRERIRSAILRWTLSDVPIACSLSGGLDSSSLVGVIAQSGISFQTYSLGFEGGAEKLWNELPLARVVAERWQTKHHELILNPDTLLDEILLMAWHLDEPYGGGLPSWAVFKRMSEDVKVALTGTGGDELFGNYGKWRRLEPWIFSGLFQCDITRHRFETDFLDRSYYFSDADKRRYLQLAPSKDVSTRDYLYQIYSSSNSSNPRDGIAYVDMATQLPEEFLMMTDRFSMAHSIEARTPFLDHELAEFVLSISARSRAMRRDPKRLLKSAMKTYIPSEVRHAPKRGFVIPLKLWLRKPLRPVVERLLGPQALEEQGIFKPSFYHEVVHPHLDSAVDNTEKIWAALMFQLWFHLYLERSSVERPSYDLRTLVT